jgi:hypothetical protein
MSGWRCRPGNGSVRSVPFPEPTPPGLNHLVVTGTVSGEARQARSPQGDPVVLFSMAFPVRDPERPQQLWTWAIGEVEVPELLAEQSLPGLQIGAPVLAGGQLSEREAAGGKDRRGVIVADIVHPGDPPSDCPSGLLILGDG